MAKLLLLLLLLLSVKSGHDFSFFSFLFFVFILCLFCLISSRFLYNKLVKGLNNCKLNALTRARRDFSGLIALSLSVCVCVCDFLHIFWGRSLRQYYFYSYYFYLYFVVVFFRVSSASVPIASHASNLRRGRGRALVLLSYSQHTARLTASPGQRREVEKRNETKRSIASPPHNILCVCVLLLRLFFSISVWFKQCARTISFLFTYKIRLFILRWVSCIFFYTP